MPAILDRIFGKSRKENLTRRERIDADIRQAVILIGDSEILGDTSGDKIDLDDEFYASLFDEAGWTEADIVHNVKRYKKRIESAKLAPRQKKLTAQAQQLYDEAVALRKKVDEQYALGLQQVSALAEERRQAEAEGDRAMAAANYLRDTAETTPQEKQLIQDERVLRDRISAIELKLNPADDAYHPGLYWGDVSTRPAKLLRQCEYELNRKDSGFTKEKQAELARWRDAAKKAVAQCERELAALNKQRDGIQRQLADCSAAKLRPESFKLVRPTPTRDDQWKSNARQIGMASETLVGVNR